MNKPRKLRDNWTQIGKTTIQPFVLLHGGCIQKGSGQSIAELLMSDFKQSEYGKVIPPFGVLHPL